MPIVDIYKSADYQRNVDSVVIQVMIEDIPGGRSLDVAGIPDVANYVKAGHVIIRNTTTKEFRALGYTDGGAYEALPVGYAYAGILYVTVPKDRPFGSIMVRGTVNTVAAVEVQGLPAYPADAITELSNLIRFVEA